MNLVAWYEAYWAAKDDQVDHRRLDLMLAHVQSGWRVFELDGGPGMLAERMVKERGAEVVMTDLTHEATARAQAKGLNASQLYIAEGDIPHPDASFDAVVSDSAIADVGQNKWEEVDYQPAQSSGGEHYGWDTTEGTHCFEPADGCDTAGITMPVVEYGHDQGCSITGGYIYRGQDYPQLTGVYFYADYCTGFVWALRRGDDGGWRNARVFASDLNIASFGEDEMGELYVLDLGGAVHRLAAVNDQ